MTVVLRSMLTHQDLTLNRSNKVPSRTTCAPQATCAKSEPLQSSTFLALLDHIRPLQGRTPAILVQLESFASVPLFVRSLAQRVIIVKMVMKLTLKM